MRSISISIVGILNVVTRSRRRLWMEVRQDTQGLPWKRRLRIVVVHRQVVMNRLVRGVPLKILNRFVGE